MPLTRRIRIVKHSAVSDTGSYEVWFANGCSNACSRVS